MGCGRRFSEQLALGGYFEELSLRSNNLSGSAFPPLLGIKVQGPGMARGSGHLLTCGLDWHTSGHVSKLEGKGCP